MNLCNCAWRSALTDFPSHRHFRAGGNPVVNVSSGPGFPGMTDCDCLQFSAIDMLTDFAVAVSR